MKSFVKFLILVACFCGAFSAGAQDLIHKKNGQVIEAKVVELGTGEVKYRLFNQPDGPIYVVEKESLLKIVFQDGHTEFYGQMRMDATELFEGQRKSNLKTAFLGPLLGYTTLTYERNIRPGRSWEVKAIIVGLGKQQIDRPRGFIASGAFKFYKKPTFYTTNLRRTHLLQGAYIKPEVFFGPTSYDFDFGSGGGDTREHSFAAGILLNLGKQWVFDDAFVLDFSGGIGYGTGISTRAIYTAADNGNVGLAGSLSLNVGWMLK